MPAAALGDVMAALSSSAPHVPYRNSRLTFLLQDSLAACARVCLLVAVSPTKASCPESLCSLAFASRCRAVQLGPSYTYNHKPPATPSSSSSSSSSSSTTNNPKAAVMRSPRS